MKFDKKTVVIVVLLIVAAYLLLSRGISGYNILEVNKTTDATKCICPSSDQPGNPWVLNASPTAPMCNRRACDPYTTTCPYIDGMRPGTVTAPTSCPCKAGYHYNPRWVLGRLGGRRNFICMSN